MSKERKVNHPANDEVISPAKAAEYLRAYANHRMMQLQAVTMALNNVKSCLDVLPNSEEKSELLKDVIRRQSEVVGASISKDTATTLLLVKYVGGLPIPQPAAKEQAAADAEPEVAEVTDKKSTQDTADVPTASGDDDDVEIPEAAKPGEGGNEI